MEQLQKELKELKEGRNRSPGGVAKSQSAAINSGQKEAASGSSSSHQAQANGSGEECQNGDTEVMEVETQEEGRAQANRQKHGSPSRHGKEEKHRYIMGFHAHIDHYYYFFEKHV